ncbi:Ser-Thr-rich glycosyl-phosphatidyl-inositol-anchored membrane family-domain-containing protein [Aspergillus egyptiacus]|nr:Ser-Thr-rich glycosyl-phosphatidyl-inositol-anchored membrane family-domain-containing protein [Aspergillus egyptiacus]
MRFFQTGLISALVAVASAYTTPDYSVAPSGNAILTPGLDEQVPAGQPYKITWDPTTEGLVSLVLLRGPSTNVQPIDTIAESIPNSGSYVWTPSTKLEPDVTHYALLLVVESGPNKGAYQWSTQWGIKNPQYTEDSFTTTAVSVPTSQPTATPTGTPTAIPPRGAVTKTSTVTTTVCPEAEVSQTCGSPVIVPPTVPTGTFTTSTSIIPSAPSSSSSSSAAWTPTFTPAPPQFTGAAGRNAVSLGAVAAGVAAVLAF